MLIIIEGADCTGKSTLARAIMETDVENGMTYITKGPPTYKNPVQEYLWPLSRYVPGDGFHYVCDRWHIGEMIYPEVFNRETTMNKEHFKIIDGVLRNLGAFVIHLHPGWDTVKERYEKRGDKRITNIDQLWKSYDLFDTFMYNHREAFPVNTVTLTGILDHPMPMTTVVSAIIHDARILEQNAKDGMNLL